MNDESFPFQEEHVLAFSNWGPLPEFPISTDLLHKNLDWLITSVDGDILYAAWLTLLMNAGSGELSSHNRQRRCQSQVVGHIRWPPQGQKVEK